MERPCSSAHVLESSCCRPCVQDPAEGWGSAALWRVSREGDEAWGGVGPDTSLCGTLEFQPGDEGLLGQARSATLQLCGLGPRFFIRKMGPLAALCNNAITWLAGSMTRHL